MEKINEQNETAKTKESHNILDNQSVIVNEDTGIVTLPERNLANLEEALAYTREQEKAIISKLRESNKYVVNEVKEMLEEAFELGIQYYIEKGNPNKQNYTDPLIPNIELTIKFLSGYEGNLQNFMDALAQEIKGRRTGRGNKFQIMCNRFGVTEDELIAMDTISLIEKMKEDIKNIPSLNDVSNYDSTGIDAKFGTALFYISAIVKVCRKFGYKG